MSELETSTCQPAQALSSNSIVERFRWWMSKHRGVMDSTLDGYCRILRDLVQVLGEDPALYEAGSLRQFVLTRAAPHSRVRARTIATATRMFLRFLVAEGSCRHGLEMAIPTIPAWRLSSLPRYLLPADVERIVGSCDRATAVGLRDHAVLLMLARLGLRAGDVAALKLDDVAWQKGLLRVSGKGRRESLLPLPQAVGDAVLAYLEQGRPISADCHLFVRSRPPFVALKSRSVTAIVAAAIGRAQVNAPSHGAHLLRHSLATAMVREGHSLQEIAVLLRHRSLETTALYAKVDLSLLREVVQPWPEVRSC